MIRLQRIADNATVSQWNEMPLGRVLIPGTSIRVHSPSVGLEVHGHVFDEVISDPVEIDLGAAVNNERDRRIAAGVTFGGKVYQSDSTSKQRLLGVCLQATLAIMNGAQANNMRWADPDSDFTYISADNTAVVMDAPTVIALGQAVAGHEKAMIYKARALKDRPGGPPADYANDEHWT